MKEIYLTFDMDWAIDEVLEDFNELMNDLDLCGELNVTHSTKFLNVFRKEGRLELGIHPNYNPLLLNQNNELEARTVDDVLSYVKGIVPEAVTCRSHALTSGSILISRYEKYGIKYDLNMLIWPRKRLRLFPNRLPGTEAVLLPFIFEDDTWMSQAEKSPVDFFLSDEFEAPRIFNFHPFHLYLNTNTIEQYVYAKKEYKNIEWIKQYRQDQKYGTRDFFIDLVNSAKTKGWSFRRISDKKW